MSPFLSRLFSAVTSFVTSAFTAMGATETKPTPETTPEEPTPETKPETAPETAPAETPEEPAPAAPAHNGKVLDPGRNPDGPTYTEHFGERFTSNWGQRTFEWSGFQWSIHGPFGAPQARHPRTGLKHWTPDCVTLLDNGDMKFASKGIDGGAEIMLVPSTGYGVYEFEYSADFDQMHPSNVLGIFTYDWREFNHGGGYTEMDFIEISRWNAPQVFREPYASVTYYPDDLTVKPDGNGVIPAKFSIPNGPQRLTTRAEWRKDFLRVTTTLADGTVLNDVIVTERVPRDNCQQVHINLWTCEQHDKTGYQGYRTARGDAITFHKFSYTPEGE